MESENIGEAAAASTLASKIAQRLRHDIVTGVLKPGMKLRTEDLTTRYGVGATPVREALNRLASDGLAVLSDKRGFRVPQVSIEELEDLTLTRCWIQELAIKDSIAHADAQWEEEIVLAFHRLSRAAPSGPAGEHNQGPQWEPLHRAFHEALISRCRSQRLRDYTHVLFDQADRYRHLGAEIDTSRDLLGEHRALMEAVLAHDVTRALECSNRHIQETTDAVLAHLRRAAASKTQAGPV
jgi:GntR family transcriptional regulator, carbon starvation induced regulator